MVSESPKPAEPAELGNFELGGIKLQRLPKKRGSSPEGPQQESKVCPTPEEPCPSSPLPTRQMGINYSSSLQLTVSSCDLRGTDRSVFDDESGVRQRVAAARGLVCSRVVHRRSSSFLQPTKEQQKLKIPALFNISPRQHSLNNQ